MQKGVTPHAGVWIETGLSDVDGRFGFVTPHAGVWIETSKGKKLKSEYSCHASCRRVD